MDPYIDQYADRTASMTVSAVRALFSVANRPEVVSLAGGMPNIADLPLGRLGESFGELVRTRGVQAMQYGSGQGEPFMRERVVDVMAEEQIRAHSDDIVITCGSQQALDLVTRIFIDPGDVVLCEAPSYVGALGTFNAYQAEIHHAAMDEHGLVPAAVADAVTALRAAGKRVKFLYTIPNFNNPTGIQQPLERRHALLQVAHELGLLVVEDNPYGLLAIDGEPLPALRSLDPEVIYLGSFSKTFAPGFRVGWVLAPPAVRERLVIAQEAAVLSPPVFSQFAVSNYLENFDWRGQIVAFRTMYRARRDAMLAGLADHMPATASWTRPTGGFFVWLTLPEGLDSQALLARAVSERVAYVPGNAFYADGFGSRNVRLSYCYPKPESIYEGTRRLGKVICDELEMRATFGLSATDIPHEPVGGPAPDLS